MKTKEFVETAKELGYTTSTHMDNIKVSLEPIGGAELKIFDIARVSTTRTHLIDTSFVEFQKLSKHNQDELFDLLVEYARTPIEERKDEERFVIKSKFSRHYAGACIDNYLWEADGDIYLSENPWGFKTSFTKKEIEVIKEKYQVSLDDFELIEEEKWGND